MVTFSANLGFLWSELELPDAIRAAKAAGFEAVECHWPYEVAPERVKSALDETGLVMLGLNTRRGDVAAGEMGLRALPGREHDAVGAIEQALGYAKAIGAKSIHVMAGNAQGRAAHETFVRNLRVACSLTKDTGIDILIEPLNRFDAPEYFLRSVQQAKGIIEEVCQPNLKLMFDCYHVGRTEGDVIRELNAALPLIGHIQFAAVPDRGAPDHGDLEYSAVFAEIDRLGWTRPLGAEYRPVGPVEASLGWMHRPAPADPNTL